MFLNSNLSLTINLEKQSVCNAKSICYAFLSLAAPNSVMTYTNPVGGGTVTINARTSAPGSCTDYIDILQGPDLVLTCTSMDSDPAATIRLYQGDGGALPAGDTLFGISDASHEAPDAQDASLFDTTFPYTLALFGVLDHGTIISCEASNNVGTAVSTACIRYLGKFFLFCFSF